MPKLYRPHIPFKVRCMVLARQIYATGRNVPGREEGESLQHLVDRLRTFLFDDLPNALDHHPALVNRKRCVRGGKTLYQPDANDPEHLMYREAGPGSDHDIKTRVRGDGAQRSDLGQRRYNKRVEENRGKRQRPKAKIVARRNPWPKRSFKGSAR